MRFVSSLPEMSSYPMLEETPPFKHVRNYISKKNEKGIKTLVLPKNTQYWSLNTRI